MIIELTKLQLTYKLDKLRCVHGLNIALAQRTLSLVSTGLPTGPSCSSSAIIGRCRAQFASAIQLKSSYSLQDRVDFLQSPVCKTLLEDIYGQGKHHSHRGSCCCWDASTRSDQKCPNSSFTQPAAFVMSQVSWIHTYPQCDVLLSQPNLHGNNRMFNSQNLVEQHMHFHFSRPILEVGFQSTGIPIFLLCEISTNRATDIRRVREV